MDRLRRQKLEHLIATMYGGSRERFMRKTGYTKSRLSQLLSPKHQFGEAAGRKLAKAAGLPEDYFDSVDERTLRFVVAFEALPEPVKAQWEHLTSLLQPSKPPEG